MHWLGAWQVGARLRVVLHRRESPAHSRNRLERCVSNGNKGAECSGLAPNRGRGHGVPTNRSRQSIARDGPSDSASGVPSNPHAKAAIAPRSACPRFWGCRGGSLCTQGKVLTKFLIYSGSLHRRAVDTCSLLSFDSLARQRLTIGGCYRARHTFGGRRDRCVPSSLGAQSTS
jgi:hypothetical protein